MQKTSDRPRFINKGTLFAVVATTVPGLMQGLADLPSQLAPWLVAVTAVALACATAGIAWAERQPTDGPLGAVTALYAASVAASLFVSNGNAFLTALPLASMLVLFFSPVLAATAHVALIALVTALVARNVPQGRLAGAVISIASAFIFVFIFSLIARRERYARRDVERLNAQVEELATARERNRIAREIHDTLGHYLTVANVQVEAARGTAEGRDERLARVQQLLRDALTELRSSVSLLREGSSAPKPFAQALDGLVAECNATGLAAQLTTHGEARPLPAQVSFTLYRAAQEALTNVRRHASAKRVEVQLSYEPSLVLLKVEDDGVGGAPRAGNGLKGLEERVTQVGGKLAFDAPPGGGFRLRVEVPA